VDFQLQDFDTIPGKELIVAVNLPKESILSPGGHQRPHGRGRFSRGDSRIAPGGENSGEIFLLTSF